MKLKRFRLLAFTLLFIVAFTMNLGDNAYASGKLSIPKITSIKNINSASKPQQSITIKYTDKNVKAEIYRAEVNSKFKKIAITKKKVYISKTILSENTLYRYKVRLVKVNKNGKKIYSSYSKVMNKRTMKVTSPEQANPDKVNPSDEEWRKDDLNHNGIPDWDETDNDVKDKTEDEKRGDFIEETIKNDPNPVNVDINVIFKLVNKSRQDIGVSPLTINEKLIKVAEIRAKEINPNSNGVFSHNRPNGSSYITAFNEVGLGGNNYSENICGADSSKECFYTWWFSTKGHKENMLNSKWTCMGWAIDNGYCVMTFS